MGKRSRRKGKHDNLETITRCQSSDKLIYENRKDAKRVVKEMVEAGRVLNNSLGIYRCSFCSKWHVGHHRKKKK